MNQLALQQFLIISNLETSSLMQIYLSWPVQNKILLKLKSSLFGKVNELLAAFNSRIRTSAGIVSNVTSLSDFAAAAAWIMKSAHLVAKHRAAARTRSCRIIPTFPATTRQFMSAGRAHLVDLVSEALLIRKLKNTNARLNF